MTRLLLLSGSAEAAAIARALGTWSDVEVVRSLAGVTATPADLPGEVRTGGFGGVDGLTDYLRDTGVDLIVDATHPFARTMPWHAAEAASAVSTPRLRVVRAPWSPTAADDWHPVPDLGGVRGALGALGARRPFLALGRLALAEVGALPGCAAVVRSIEPIGVAPFTVAAAVVARGPFTLDDELALLREHRIDAVVTRNSGGTAAAAKLDAARRLGLPVVVVDRPPQPPGPTVDTVEKALAWIRDGARAESPVE